MEAVHESPWEENLSSGSQAGTQQLAATGKGGEGPGAGFSQCGSFAGALCRALWGGWDILQVCSCVPLEMLHQMFSWESVSS